MTRQSKPTRHARGRHVQDKDRAINRLVVSFEYVGPKMSRIEAEQQLNAWPVKAI